MQQVQAQALHKDLKAALSYNRSTGDFTWLIDIGVIKKGMIAGCRERDHTLISFKGVRYLAHKLAWFWTFGSWPNGPIKHKNGNNRDNALDNLTILHSESGFPGVTIAPNGKYKAAVYHKGKKLTLGTFEKGAKAYEVCLLKKLELQGV